MNASRARLVLGWLPLTVLTAVLGVLWARFLGGGMASVRAWLYLISLGPLAGFVLLLATGIRSIARPRMLPKLALTGIVAAQAMWPASWNVGRAPMRYPFSLAKVQPRTTVRLPTDAPMRVMWGGDELHANYHAQLPDQRWAYDLSVEPAAHGSKRLEDYGCFGTPIVAPVRGRVHAAHDGEPDTEPATIPSNYKAPLGNHLVLALEDRFLVIAHMKRGSVVAHEGDLIEEGAPVGQCGNSGNTSEPHVHVHVQRQDPKKYPVNLAEGLPLFFRDHDGAPMPRGGFEIVGGKIVLRGDKVRHLGKTEQH